MCNNVSLPMHEQVVVQYIQTKQIYKNIENTLPVHHRETGSYRIHTVNSCVTPPGAVITFHEILLHDLRKIKHAQITESCSTAGAVTQEFSVNRTITMCFNIVLCIRWNTVKTIFMADCTNGPTIIWNTKQQSKLWLSS